MKDLLKKCFVEFIGTFFLILTVGLTVFTSAQGVIPAIAIGFVLMVFVYAGGHVSGAHYNPAVSIAAAVRGALEWKNLIFYWIAQCLGASLAAYTVTNLVSVPAAVPETYCLKILILAECLFTFALCYVVLHTATSDDTNGNSYYGLAIGSTVTVGAFATAGLCYGAFNPAVACGLFVMGAATMKIVGITAITNIIAGIIAGIVYKMTAND